MSNARTPRRPRQFASPRWLASLAVVVGLVAGAATASPATALPSGPDCADVQLQVPFNTAGTATFSCSGAGLTYEVDLADHGRVGEAEGNAVAYSPNGGYFGSDTFEVIATDAQDRSDSFLVHVTVDPPLAVTPDPSDQLTGQDADGFWDLEAGETDTFTLSCAPGKVAVDGSALVQTVDQGTGQPADVQVLEAWRTDRRTYEFRLFNPASGRAQGHLAVACVSERTFQGHALEFRRGAQGTIEFGGDTSGGPGDATLRSAPEPEFEPEFEPEGPTETGDLKSVTLSCGDGWTAVAPSYDVTSGSALPIQSEAAPDGESWTFTFMSWGDATVETSISCLSYADKALQVLLRSTRLSTVATVPGGDTTKRDTALDCPVGFIGIVGGYATTPSLAVLGQETQAKRRLFWLQNLAAGAQSATVSLLCVGLTTDTTTSLITPAGVSVPPPGAAPEPTPHTTPVPSATPRPRPVGRITSRRLRAKRGYVHITIACPRTDSCEGRVILSDGLTYLGSARYAGSRGTTTRVRMRLTAAARRALREASASDPLVITATLDDGSQVTITIRP